MIPKLRLATSTGVVDTSGRRPARQVVFPAPRANLKIKMRYRSYDSPEHDYDFDRDASPFDFEPAERDVDDEFKAEALRTFASPRRDPGMPMTRRDVDALYDKTLRDAKSYVAKKRDKTSSGGERSPATRVVEAAETVVGAALAGYLAQRFRLQSGPLPAGLVLGVIGHAAAHFKIAGTASADHLHALSNGLMAGAAAIWGAGYGAVGSEKAASHAADAVQQPFTFRTPGTATAPSPAAAFAAGAAPTMQLGAPIPGAIAGLADLQSLAARYGRAA